MERIILYGSCYFFTSSKTGELCYKLDYIDEATGRAKSDYLTSVEEYNAIASQNIEIGTTCIGNISLNKYDKPYVSSITIN